MDNFCTTKVGIHPYSWYNGWNESVSFRKFIQFRKNDKTRQNKNYLFWI